MASDMHTVRFEPDGRKLEVAEGTTIAEAAALAGIPVEGPCGGQGTCGKCLVTVSVDGEGDGEGEAAGAMPAPTHFEKEFLTKASLDEGQRLACRFVINSNIVVEVPSSSRRYRQSILIDGWGKEASPSLDPNVKRSPSKEAAKVVGDGGGEPVILIGGRIVARGDAATTGRLLGVAVDLGTTTVASQLLDLETGRVLASHAEMNPQIAIGEDIITRMSHALKDAKDLVRLREMARDIVRTSVVGLCLDAGVPGSDVYELMMVGNTCMHHIFFGLDISGLAKHPFAPAERGVVERSARSMGLGMNDEGSVASLPVVAGFLGADAMGAALAAALDTTPPSGHRMVVDIGTNAEVMLCSGGKMMGASSPAGPAFEGAQISCGMRAGVGAISAASVSADGNEEKVTTIGDETARGIAGSGLLDLVAGMFDAGIFDATGRIKPDHPRVSKGSQGLEFLVTDKPRIVVTQRDVRQVQLAKAAVMSGIRMVLKEADIGSSKLDELVLAGAFGTFIDRAKAIRIGMLPDIPLKNMTVAGDAALVGARMALLSVAQRKRAEAIATRMKHVHLAGRKEFQDEFVKCLRF